MSAGVGEEGCDCVVAGVEAEEFKGGLEGGGRGSGEAGLRWGVSWGLGARAGGFVFVGLGGMGGTLESGLDSLLRLEDRTWSWVK